MPPSKRAALQLSAAAACALALAVVTPTATAALTFDDQGYVDSTARCSAPATAVMFGSTQTSRVAICKSSGGKYEYRGVRVRDGARLIAPASSSDDGAFVADNDGIEYMLSAKSLVVSAGSTVIREESWLDFHGSGVSSAPASPTSTAPTSTAPKAPPASPAPPLRPLPAEVGGSGSS